MTSRFSKKSDPKNYTIILRIPSIGDIEDILSYCTCKTGSHTIGGCAALYLLTVTEVPQSKKWSSMEAKTKIGFVLDVREFKREKKQQRVDTNDKVNQMEQDDTE